MSLLPLFGHEQLRERLSGAVAREMLPASVLLHGPRGVGKQRLALWLGQLLLCEGAEGRARPCGECQACSFVLALAHPDVRWFFPRPRLSGASASSEEVMDDYADALAERAKNHGLYAPPGGTEAIYVASVRALVRLAAYTPTMGRRKVFIAGDAERMVPQEGADAAANAFLKLLEEPPPDTTLILTSSEPGALLPTIRSRVVSIRVAPIADADVRQFVANDTVRAALDRAGAVGGLTERVALAAGAPGALLGAGARSDAHAAAANLLAAMDSGRKEQLAAAFALGGSKARGFFTEVLDALTLLLHQRARESVARHDRRGALRAIEAVNAVEQAKEMAAGNVSPQLLGAALLRQMPGRAA
jgi:DNA polymerase III subunit delta'